MGMVRPCIILPQLVHRDSLIDCANRSRLYVHSAVPMAV
jgi:hypothetical protein